jgi:EAL domain-containing protein (putative c-di-GMP-specific phosphodiesterase class I)
MRRPDGGWLARSGVSDGQNWPDRSSRTYRVNPLDRRGTPMRTGGTQAPSGTPADQRGVDPAGWRLETVLRHCADAVALLDVDGRVVDWNEAAQRAFEQWGSEGRPEGRRLSDLLPGEARSEAASAWHLLQSGLELATATTTVGGQPFRLHLGGVAHHGRLQGVVAAWRSVDPSERSADVAAGLAEDLRRGIAAGELRLHYQPIVELASARPVATEALVRWQHPQRGLLPPAQFIDFAERTGLVVGLGSWVLHSACRQAAAWDRTSATHIRPGYITVNLSARQLRGPELLGTLRDALDVTGCPPGRIVLEVTETAVMADLGAAVQTLTAVKDLGVGLAIDDFGTGYSSLLYLKHFPVDTIKVDRSFVAGLGREDDDTAIVAATVSLAHSVDVRCVAEGVETVEHLDLLRGMGCDYAQGFLFSRPLDQPDVEEWFDSHGGGSSDAPLRSEALPQAVVSLLGEGASLHTIAAALNSQGGRTPKGTRWNARSVAHLIAGHRPDGGSSPS